MKPSPPGREDHPVHIRAASRHGSCQTAATPAVGVGRTALFDALSGLLDAFDAIAWLWKGDRNGWLNNLFSRLLFVLFCLAALAALLMLCLGEWRAAGLCAGVAAVLMLITVVSNKLFA